MNLKNQLFEMLGDIQAVGVEVILVCGAIVLLISGLIHNVAWLTKWIYALTVLIAVYANWVGFETGTALSESLFITPISHDFTALFLVSSLFILLYKRKKKHAVEFYFFILSLLTGSLFLMKANSLLVVYLAIELTSFTSYIITNFSFKREGYEAGIKYLLFGAVSSAIMLFGLGLIYGSTGTFFISEWTNGLFEELLPRVGLALALFGLFFKASIIPFHSWVPAIYQSAPNDAVAFMSIVPKLAGLLLLQRMVMNFSVESVNWLATICLFLGMLTIISGTFSALRQSNVRRMISFGAIAHSGFLFPFVWMDSPTAIGAFWWYSVVYALMNLAIFYFLEIFETDGRYKMENYISIGGGAPVISIAMTMVLISLVGLPPFAGFTAKFFLFTSLWEFYTTSDQSIYVVYLIVAVFASVISLFLYLRIPYYLFIVKPTTAQSLNCSFSTKIIATLFSSILLLLFLAPQILTVMQQLFNSIRR